MVDIGECVWVSAATGGFDFTSSNLLNGVNGDDINAGLSLYCNPSHYERDNDNDTVDLRVFLYIDAYGVCSETDSGVVCDSGSIGGTSGGGTSKDDC